jgi:hypothetical protein
MGESDESNEGTNMKRISAYLAIITVATALAWGQRGHGGGAGVNGGHGAPVKFPPKTATGTGVAGGARVPNVSARVAGNAALSARIQPLLPAGTTVSTAAAGFRSQGQFLAAVHVSKNLGIPFDQLKTEMTGTSHASLGSAIRDLRPALDNQAVKRSVKLAERQARLDTKPGRATEVSPGSTQNPRLASRVGTLLPEGMTLQSASEGFRNQGQFIAALHVSRNLGIPFAQLKAQILTGRSLGQAIADLRPALTSTEVDADVRVAERQTRVDVVTANRTVTRVAR